MIKVENNKGSNPKSNTILNNMFDMIPIIKPHYVLIGWFLLVKQHQRSQE